jgi:hypothetical protein
MQGAALLAAYFVFQMAMMFGLAFFSPLGPHNGLILLMPIPVVALLLFPGAAARTAAVAALVLLIWPAGIAADLVAHLLGGCLY